MQDVQSLALCAQQYLHVIDMARQVADRLQKQSGPLPLVVPTHLGVDEAKRPKIESLNSHWETATIAHLYDQFYSQFPAPTPPAIEKFMSILKSYRDGNVRSSTATSRTIKPC